MRAVPRVLQQVRERAPSSGPESASSSTLKTWPSAALCTSSASPGGIRLRADEDAQGVGRAVGHLAQEVAGVIGLGR